MSILIYGNVHIYRQVPLDDAKMSILIYGNVHIYRQVPLDDAKMSKEAKFTFYKLLQKYDTILSKCNNDIGQTYLIKMHIATRPDAAPVAVQPYPLAF